MLGQAPTPSLVLALLEGRRPSAVAGSIRPVVVDPLDRQSRRRFAHVFKEGLKTVAPSITDRNATAAIVFERLGLRVEAALFHLRPALEGGSAPAPMRADTGAQFFTMQTAATDCQASGHVSHRDRFFGATVASAKPNRSSKFVSTQKAAGDEATEALPSDIFESGHNGLRERLLCQGTARRFSGGPSCYFSTFPGALQ